MLPSGSLFSEMALSASFYIVTVITNLPRLLRSGREKTCFIYSTLREVWGLGAEGFEEKNGFDDVIKLLVYARGE